MTITGIESWPADSEISITRQHCYKKMESEISGDLYTNGRKIIRSRIWLVRLRMSIFGYVISTSIRG